jgi:prepilin-type N-terminal cleavage/methylation domain-containing protein
MRAGFSLVELLVVLTIIVVPLALLTPALEGTMHEAEPAVCGARLAAVATSIVTYAVDQKRPSAAAARRPAVHGADAPDQSRCHDRA